MVHTGEPKEQEKQLPEYVTKPDQKEDDETCCGICCCIYLFYQLFSYCDIE
jgi:hypothetical protein